MHNLGQGQSSWVDCVLPTDKSISSEYITIFNVMYIKADHLKWHKYKKK
jgi:hypothetical protein